MVKNKNTYCAVEGCRNSSKPIEGVSFHTIPFTNSNRAKEWIRNLNLTGYTLGTVICSDHFEKEDFVINSRSPSKRLTRDAVPLPCVIETLVPEMDASPDRVTIPEMDASPDRVMIPEMDASPDRVTIPDMDASPDCVTIPDMDVSTDYVTISDMDASPVTDEEYEIEEDLPMPSPQLAFEEDLDSEIKAEETENLPFDIAESNTESIAESNRESMEDEVDYCHACLSRCSSVTILSGCLRDTYVELCGVDSTAPAMCHLCRRLLLNAIRFKNQCRAAVSFLQYLNFHELTMQNISDDFRKSLQPHLNLTIVQNCNVFDIKHDSDAVKDVFRPKPTKNLNNKMELSNATKKVKVEKEVAKSTPSEIMKKVEINKNSQEPVVAPPLEIAESPKLYLEIHPLTTNLDSDDSDNFSDTPLTDLLFVKPKKRSTTNTDANAAQINVTPQNDSAPSPRKLKKKNDNFLQEKRFDDHMTTTRLTPAEQANIILKRKDKKSYKTSKYKCDVCFKTFSSKQSFECHMYNHSRVRGAFVCEVCRMRFSRKKNLKKHMVNHMFKYTCKLCPFKSQSRTSSNSHITVHEKKKLECSVCDMIFHHKSTYLSHMRIHHPTSSFVCQLCGYSFLNQKGLHIHKQKIHLVDNRNIPEDGPFCDKCNTRFIDWAAFDKHLEVTACANSSNYQVPVSQKTRKPIKCEQCAEVLQTYVEYRCHFKTEHPDKMSIQTALDGAGASLCDICGKVFRCAAVLKYHLPVHDPTTTYPCDQCGGSYATPARLAVHKKIHTVSFSCATCGREFSQQGNRDRHVRYAHTNVKNVKCRSCDKMFKSEERRKTHEGFVHLNRPYPKRDRKLERERSLLKRDRL